MAADALVQVGRPPEARERLGAGAITESFVATSFGAEGFEKTVVVKRVHAELAAIPRFVDGFLAEAQRASALSHANVVLLMDVARDDAGYRLVTEYVDGVDLATLLTLARAAGASLPDEMIAFVGAEIAKGLDYAHRRRGGAVVHGGLSPSNVLVSRDGAVKVSDFGVHRAREDARFAPHETRAAPYRAPERVGGGEATKAGDLFALGAILRELGDGRTTLASVVPIDALVGPEDGRPTAGEVHERVIAWAFKAGSVAHQASELAKLVARLRRDGSAALPTADVAADTSAFEPSPRLDSTAAAPEPGGASAPEPARYREVVLVAVAELGGADGAELVRRSIEDHGGAVTSADDAELRAVFGLASDAAPGRSAQRPERAALRACLAIAAGLPRAGSGVDVGRALVDERGRIVDDASASERFSRVAALASVARGQVSISPELIRSMSTEFEFGADGRRAFVIRERERPLATSGFVGRRAELARLGARWAGAREGAPSVVAITGEAGAGKTRLALEFERRVMLRDPSTRAGFVGAPSDAWDALDLVIVEAFDGIGPLLSRAVSAARAAGARTLWIVVARGLDLLSGDGAAESVQALVDEELSLGALSDDEIAELAASMLGARVLTPEFVDRLRDAADRTPLFVTETLRDWMDEALVVVRDGVAQIHGGAIAPPRTLRALVEARLERLSTEQLGVLRALAIASEDATDEEVAAIVDVPPAAVLAARARFSPLVRQVVLDALPIDARRALHAAAERALSPPALDPAAPRRAERVATHRLESGDAAGARDAFVHAATSYARPADRARAAAAALRLITPTTTKGEPSAADFGARIPRLVAMLAAGAELGVGAEAWLDLARDAFERVDRSGALADRVVVRLETARLAVHLAAVPEARVALDQASNLAIDVRLRARVLATEMELAIRTGEIARGRDASSALFELGSIDARSASASAAETGRGVRELESPSVLADAAEIFGAARDERAAETALALALDLGADGSPAVRAALEARRARIELLLGHPARALRASVVAVDLADAVGATRLRAEAKLTLAESSLHAGRLDRAYAALVAALEAAESSGHTRAATSAAALLAWLDAPADVVAARAKLAALEARSSARGFAADALAIRLLAARLPSSSPETSLEVARERARARAQLEAVEAEALRLGHAALAADARTLMDADDTRGLPLASSRPGGPAPG